MRLWVCGKVVHNKCQPIKNGLRMCLNGFQATLELAKPVFRQNPCLGLVKVVKVKYFGFGTLWALFTFFLPDLKFIFQCNQWKLKKKLMNYLHLQPFKALNQICKSSELIQAIHLKRLKKSTKIFSTQLISWWSEKTLILKQHQSGIWCVIEASAMRAEQGPCEPIKGCIYAKLESNSEPERARVCQRVAVRASESQNGSHREP